MLRLLPFIVASAFGTLSAVGGYTFLYARGWAYLTNDPAACANCHVMRQEYAGWQRGSHRTAAVCNDCHTPANIVAKYLTKAENGFRHSLAFTTGQFPDDIQILPRDRAIAERACLKCHAQIVSAIVGPHGGQGTEDCLRCHPSAGHME